MKLYALIKIAGNPKTKRYWQMLKRLGGGTESTVKTLKETKDFGIYHNTKPENIKNILEKGLLPMKSEMSMFPKKRVFFGNNQMANSHYGTSRIRLKYPNELKKGENYPNINNFKVPNDFFSLKQIKNLAKDEKLKINKKFREKINAYGVGPSFKKSEGGGFFSTKLKIKPNLLKEVKNYDSKAHDKFLIDRSQKQYDAFLKTPAGKLFQQQLNEI
jgi:hypothetical protein